MASRRAPTVRLTGGLLEIEHGPAVLRGLRPSVRWWAGDGIERTWAPPQLVAGSDPGTWIPAPGPAGGRPHAPFTLELVAEQLGGRLPGVLLTLHIRHLGEAPVRLAALAPLHTSDPGGLAFDGVTEPRRWQRLHQGWQSWSNARAYRPGEPQRTSRVPWWRYQIPNPNHIGEGVPGRLRSELVTAVADPGVGALVLGFVTADRQLCGIDLDLRPDGVERLEASCDLDGVVLSPGEELTSEPLLVQAGTDALVLLERWADELGERQHARVPRRPPSGWCSWYFYFTSVTGRDVEDNLAAIERLGEQAPFDYVMVDDGHQRHIGDWLDTNAKFPRGMAAYAADIRATGRDAGIWMAPFVADPRSRVAREHPDWFVRRPDGRYLAPLWNPLWNRLHAMRVLDTTHPDALAWIEDVARTMRHEWGYRILKLDFLYNAALPGLRHDPDATLATSLRLGLEAVRMGAGEDAFLLGCGCPLGPAVGIVDGMRIGADVAPYWDLTAQRIASEDEAGATTRVAVRNTLTRAFMHGRLWANDPDCVMVRTDRTRLTDAEVRSLAAAVALTDGMVVSSDRLETVPSDRLALFATVHRLTGGSPRVVDLLQRPMPEVVVSTRRRDVLVGVFNFADRPEQRVLDVTALGLPDVALEVGEVAEVLVGGAVTVRGGRADLGVLAAHDARILRFPTSPTS